MKIRKTAAGGAALLALGLLASPALAHVTVQPNEAPTGSFYRFVVRVPNERDDSSTITVEVQLPPLAFVSFQDTPGWQRQVEMVTLDEPLEVFGEQVTEVPGAVTWSGGEIEPGEFEEFGFSARMPDEETTLEFPAIQTYDSGEVVRWIGPADSEEPAARVTTVAVGLEEGQGELAAIAAMREEIEALEARASEASHDSDAPELILGFAGIGLAAAALAVALTRTRR